jgi:hypothetical protein
MRRNRRGAATYLHENGIYQMGEPGRTEGYAASTRRSTGSVLSNPLCDRSPRDQDVSPGGPALAEYGQEESVPGVQSWPRSFSFEHGGNWKAATVLRSEGFRIFRRPFHLVTNC